MVKSSSSVGMDEERVPPALVVQTSSGDTYPTLAEDVSLAPGVA